MSVNANERQRDLALRAVRRAFVSGNFPALRHVEHTRVRHMPLMFAVTDEDDENDIVVAPNNDDNTRSGSAA